MQNCPDTHNAGAYKSNPEAHCDLPLCSAAWAARNDILRELLAGGADPKGGCGTEAVAKAALVLTVPLLIDAGMLKEDCHDQSLQPHTSIKGKDPCT